MILWRVNPNKLPLAFLFSRLHFEKAMIEDRALLQLYAQYVPRSEAGKIFCKGIACQSTGKLSVILSVTDPLTYIDNKKISGDPRVNART